MPELLFPYLLPEETAVRVRATWRSPSGAPRRRVVAVPVTGLLAGVAPVTDTGPPDRGNWRSYDVEEFGFSEN